MAQVADSQDLTTFDGSDVSSTTSSPSMALMPSVTYLVLNAMVISSPE